MEDPNEVLVPSPVEPNNLMGKDPPDSPATQKVVDGMILRRGTYQLPNACIADLRRMWVPVILTADGDVKVPFDCHLFGADEGVPAQWAAMTAYLVAAGAVSGQ